MRHEERIILDSRLRSQESAENASDFFCGECNNVATMQYKDEYEWALLRRKCTGNFLSSRRETKLGEKENRQGIEPAKEMGEVNLVAGPVQRGQPQMPNHRAQFLGLLVAI